MKFCDKLQKIRKENNITQEQLADKLNVSRQAVSKWESGTAYPDTEKLIQISKIFHVSLDELINDEKIVNENNSVGNNKFNFMDTFNIVSEFLSKSFSMFWAMKFKEKIKLLFEMGILILGIMLIAFISNTIIIEIVRRLFMFLPYNIVNSIIELVDTLLYIAWIILGFIIVIRIFKTRYLDYYVIIEDDSVSERTVEEPIKELKEKKEYKLVIRDPEHSSFNLFNKIWKIFIFLLKILALFIALPLVILFISLVGIFIMSLFYLFNGIFFNGISLAILGGIVFTYILILLVYNLIFNRDNAYSVVFILFIVSISLIGIGFGLSFASLSNFKIEEDTTKHSESQTIKWNDNLICNDIIYLSPEKIIIDNDIDDIKMDIISYGFGSTRLYSYHYSSNNGQKYKVIGINYDYDDIDTYKNIIDDLKNKRISKYNSDYEIDKVYISEEHLTKLKENYANYSE